MLFLDDSTVWLPTQTWSVKNQEYAAIVRTSCCGPGVTLGWVLVSRLSPALDVGRPHVGWTVRRHVRLKGVLLLPVRCCNSVRHEPRDHRQVIPGRLRRLPTEPRQIKRLTSHCSAATSSSSQTVTANLMTWHVLLVTEVMIWNTCQWVYKVHVELVIHTVVGCLIRLFNDARWPPRGFQSD